MNYTMALSLDGYDLVIPVLPEKLEVSSPGKNEKVTILELGEALVLRKKGLRTVKWSSHFPLHPGSRSTASVPAPVEAVRRIQQARDAGKPIRLILAGADLDINMEVGVSSFDYNEQYGAVGDIFYSIELTEYRHHGPTVITAQAATVQSAPQLYEGEPPRAGEPPEQKSYTVVPGDSLWAIAQRLYGDGSRYPELYAANQELIDARNQGTGNSKYTIYPGQEFVV